MKRLCRPRENDENMTSAYTVYRKYMRMFAHPGKKELDLRLSELEDKEVINACDCKKLGYVVDLIIDECQGCIEAIIIPKTGKFCGIFCDGGEYVIPFRCVRKIGPDIILVEIHEEPR